MRSADRVPSTAMLETTTRPVERHLTALEPHVREETVGEPDARHYPGNSHF